MLGHNSSKIIIGCVEIKVHGSLGGLGARTLVGCIYVVFISFLSSVQNSLIHFLHFT